KAAENKAAESKDSQKKSSGQAGGSRSNTGSKPEIKIELIAPALENTEADQRVTLSLYPCKGEVPGNVLGVSEQWNDTDRVTAFVKKLGEADLKTRACAARQLGYLGPEAKDAVPHLIK